MPNIEIDMSDRAARHLGAIRLMSYMVFPDDAKMRLADETAMRTVTADWCSSRFAKEDRTEQSRVIRRMYSRVGTDLARALADPAAWMKREIFDYMLSSVGGIYDVAVQLTTSPSAEELDREWANRWWSIVYTGKLIELVGSIHQHDPQAASLNKAIHILRKTEGNGKHPTVMLRQRGFPGVYESSLKKAWRKFKPVAHLCAAYVITQTRYAELQLGGEFRECWKEPPVFYKGLPFLVFCSVAKWVETFATSFFSRGQRQPLITKEEIFALPKEILDWVPPHCPFRMLTEEEIAALNSYRAPKQFV
ncbi:MAG: hypothetical protein Q7T82_19575 [Armatimonadota bacterium]|nr:hypothetical protein [Armatimonadota bacterium]